MSLWGEAPVQMHESKSMMLGKSGIYLILSLKVISVPELIDNKLNFKGNFV